MSEGRHEWDETNCSGNIPKVPHASNGLLRSKICEP